MIAAKRQMAAVQEDRDRLDRELSLLHQQETELASHRSMLRRQREHRTKALSRKRAELNLLLAPAIQRELDRVGIPCGGMEAIASLAGMDLQMVWDLLSGQTRPDACTWQRISRLLAVCQSHLRMEAVAAARDICDRMVVLNDQINDLNKRLEQCGNQGNQIRRKMIMTKDELDSLCLRNDGGAQRGTDKGQVPDLPYSLPALTDIEGNDYRPDPLQAATPAEFVATMREFRQWAGKLSFREMESRCGKQISYSTFRNMLTRDTVPSNLRQVHTFVQVLGGTTDDLQRWATAWRRLTMHRPSHISHRADSEDTGGQLLQMTGTC